MDTCHNDETLLGRPHACRRPINRSCLKKQIANMVHITYQPNARCVRHRRRWHLNNGGSHRCRAHWVGGANVG